MAGKPDSESGEFSVRSADDLDRLNLEQALIDFEIANARVVDLTGRVTGMSAELMQVRSELGHSKLLANRAEGEAAALRNEIAEIKRSLAYRVLRTLGDMRGRMRAR